jgi:hypothetical protein
MLDDSVTADAIAAIVARHTGIPVSRISGKDETEQLLHMEDRLRQRVVGQDHALVAVSNCVRLARTRLQAHNRTLGNFLFLGPTVRFIPPVIGGKGGRSKATCISLTTLTTTTLTGSRQDRNCQSLGGVPL